MMLANVAWILATNGHRVLTIDWDLEAPGLHRYFHPFLKDKSMSLTDGLIDALTEYVSAAVSVAEGASEDRPISRDAAARSNAKKSPSEDRNWYKAYANLNRFAVPVDWSFPDKGKLDLIGAGRQGPSYGSKVNLFDWQQFYYHFAGGAFLEAACEFLREEYDYVLIDSRTGVSDTSGICTMQLPDALVVCFTLNNQSIEGALAVTSASRDYRLKKRDAEPLTIFPVPTRVEQNESDRVELGRELARLRFRPFVPLNGEVNPVDIEKALQLYWGNVEVPYVPKYAYEELLACFSDTPHLKSSVLAAAEQITSLICGTATELVAPSNDDRISVLQQFARKPPIVTTAEEFFLGLSNSDQNLARRVFVRMVQPSTTKSVNASDSPCVSSRDDFAAGDQPFLDRMTEARLVTKSTQDHKEIFTLADFRLITAWQRLATWIDSDREFLVWIKQLNQLRSTWAETRDPDDLLTGTILITASRWLDQRRESMIPQEIEFIEESKAADERVRRSVAISNQSAAVGRKLQNAQWELDRQEISEKTREIGEINSRLGRATKHRNLLVGVSLAFAFILIGLIVVWYLHSKSTQVGSKAPEPANSSSGSRTPSANDDRMVAEARRQQANILVSLGISTYNSASKLNAVEGVQQIDEKISTSTNPDEILALKAARINYIRSSDSLIGSSAGWTRYLCAHNSFVIAASAQPEQAAKELKRWKSSYPLSELGVGTPSNPKLPIIIDFFLTCDGALKEAASVRKKYGAPYGWTPTAGWYNDLPACSACPFRPLNEAPSAMATK